MTPLKIGVIGQSSYSLDVSTARGLLERGIEKAISEHPGGGPIEVVSALIDVGVPGLAYRIAQERGYRTVGIACAKARRYNCFPVDHEVIVGSRWGDESDTLLDYVDVIVRVGGGGQTLEEAATFQEWGGKVYEYDLDAPVAS